MSTLTDFTVLQLVEMFDVEVVLKGAAVTALIRFLLFSCLKSKLFVPR